MYVYVRCSIHGLIFEKCTIFLAACLAANAWRVVLPNRNGRKTYGGRGEPGTALT